jgi:hypothetical protein
MGEGDVFGAGLTDEGVGMWHVRLRQPEGLPAILLAAQAAQAGPWEAGRGDRLPSAGVFLAAWLWREAGFGRPLSLPLWSATPKKLHRLALTVGDGFLAGFLDCVADAAQRARRELDRLQQAEHKAAGLRRTARSHLPGAAEIAVRAPVLTAGGLAVRLCVSTQAALGLIKQLTAAGVMREATGRAAWRAFSI